MLARTGAARKTQRKDAKSKIKADGIRGMHVENLASGRPEMTQTVDRAQQFLSLVALLTALLRGTLGEGSEKY